MFTKPDLKIKKYGYVEGKVKYFNYGWYTTIDSIDFNNIRVSILHFPNN
jgi:hypothetical protein